MNFTRKVGAALCAVVFCFVALAPLSASFAIIDVELPVEPPETEEPPTTVEPPVTEEVEGQTPYPDRIPFGMRGAKLYLACVENDAIVYKADKESTYVEVKKGDSLLMFSNSMYSGFSDKEWTCVVLRVSDDLAYFEKGYIKNEHLKKSQSGKSVSRKKLLSSGGVVLMWAEITPIIVYAGKEGSEVIGVMRQGVALPLLRDNKYKKEYGYEARVATYHGIGYMYDTTFTPFP